MPQHIHVYMHIPMPDEMGHKLDTIASAATAWKSLLTQVGAEVVGDFTIVTDRPTKLAEPMKRAKRQYRRKGNADDNAPNFVQEPLNGYLPDDPHKGAVA